MLTYQTEKEDGEIVEEEKQQRVASASVETEETDAEKQDEKVFFFRLKKNEQNSTKIFSSFQRRQHEEELRAILRDEFLIQLQKFLNQIGLTLRQLEGEVRLELPANFDISKIIKSNKDIVEQAESLVYKWNGEIREALERELKKVENSIEKIISFVTGFFLWLLDASNARSIGRNRLVERTKHFVEQFIRTNETRTRRTRFRKTRCSRKRGTNIVSRHTSRSFEILFRSKRQCEIFIDIRTTFQKRYARSDISCCDRNFTENDERFENGLDHFSTL